MSDYLFTKDLPDGRTIFVTPLTYGRARIGIGRGEVFIDDAY